MTQFIHSIQLSPKRGIEKTEYDSAHLEKDFGWDDPYDYHSGTSAVLPVSLLYQKDIDTILRANRIDVTNYFPGLFSNDITILSDGGIEERLKVGDRIQIGLEEGPIINIVQIGKPQLEDITIGREVYKRRHPMPLLGIYATVEKSGIIKISNPLIKL